jgi:hypothetical protein
MRSDWQEARKLVLCRPREFLLKAFNITDNLEEYQLGVLTRLKIEDFKPDVMKAKGVCCYRLTCWLLALITFCDHMGLLDVKRMSKYGPRPN